jgi:hypothetical protein
MKTTGILVISALYQAGLTASREAVYHLKMDKKFVVPFVHMAGMLEAGLPLVPCWETLLVSESDPDIRALLELMDRNWQKMPPTPLRLVPTIEAYRERSPEWNILYHMTYIGEATGMLDILWFQFAAIYALRGRLLSGGKCGDDDLTLFQSVISYGDPFASDIDWKSWSADGTWLEQPEHEMTSSTREFLAGWFTSHQKGAPATLPAGVRSAIEQAAERGGFRELASGILQKMATAAACI